jgi:transaldolase/glucose-6-phosphate isomerase
LVDLGQSPWLDYIRRSLVTTGELLALVEDDGLRGVTSNPAIFEKAIVGSADYDDWLDELRAESLSPSGLYERLAVRDIQGAADVLMRVHDETEGADGFVSLEVSPYLAHDTEGSLAEARRLALAVGRANLMVKVPATEAGIPVVEQLIAEGINVNVTLLFSRAAYERVADAYLRGLERRVASGGDLSRVASVASFFISRIDGAVDGLLHERIATSQDEAERQRLEGLLGKTAIANAKLAYQSFRRLFRGERWKTLEREGAQKQRLLWASTSTKDPSYPDTMYIDELIAPETVNTIPMPTLNAYRDHGEPRARLEEGVETAEKTLRELADLGIDLDRVTSELLTDGVRLFAEAFDKLLHALDARCQSPVKVPVDRSHFDLPAALEREVAACATEWRLGGKMRRLWAGDPGLWTASGEERWLGWLGLTEGPSERAETYRRLRDWVRSSGFRDVVLLGMGGSSLCPDVLRRAFGTVDAFPELHVLDSTDPAQILALEGRVDLTRSLFVVSSKSGSTLEPNIFKDYFYRRVQEVLGRSNVGDRFIAVTDPGSSMEAAANEGGFAKIFPGVASVGGRYSALSNFGMVPAALIGIDVGDFLERADLMAVATSSCVPAGENPGARLGWVLGSAAKQGRDKLTLVASPRIAALGAWVEQLIAESTGKLGTGIIPIDLEDTGPPEVYGDDRLFVYVRLDTDPDAAQDRAVRELADAGHPVVRIPVADIRDLGREFFRWEIATAVAGAVLEINPFDQPDVEASKDATRALTSQYEETGRFPEEAPLLEDHEVALFADATNASALRGAVTSHRSLTTYLRAHVDRLVPGDYFALLAYIESNTVHEALLQEIRHMVRDRRRVATCVGFGPRFLHSTGQAYKGGPNSGVFLQLTCDDDRDLQVPGRRFTFGVVKAAQARGDFAVLAERGRRALRAHLGRNVEDGLVRVRQAVSEALS